MTGETEPAWEPDATTPGVWRPTRVPRSVEEEQFLTDFSRNYLAGRRWLCRLAHACVALGIMIGALAAGWDHILAVIERTLSLISRATH